LLALFLWECAGSGLAAAAQDCTAEAQILSEAQSELPRLDVAAPRDKPPYCITLETIIAFARRVKAHVAQCPNSDFAPAVADWVKTQTDYSKLFTQHRCKRTL
jgi:hypothetical protein